MYGDSESSVLHGGGGLKDSGCMYDIWMCFKKGYVYKSNQYREFHFTPILVEIVEHVIGESLVKFLVDRDYGNEQWVFRKKVECPRSEDRVCG